MALTLGWYVRRWQRWAVAGLAGITIEFAKVCDDKPKWRMCALTNPDTPANPFIAP
jgi:hypothetical protein